MKAICTSLTEIYLLAGVQCGANAAIVVFETLVHPCCPTCIVLIQQTLRANLVFFCILYSLRHLQKCYHLSWTPTVFIVQPLAYLISVPLKPLSAITVKKMSFCPHPVLFPYQGQVSNLRILFGLPCVFSLSVCGQHGSCFVCCIGNNNIRGVSACKTKLSKVVWLQVGSHQPCVHKLVSSLFLPAICVPPSRIQSFYIFPFLYLIAVCIVFLLPGVKPNQNQSHHGNPKEADKLHIPFSTLIYSTAWTTDAAREPRGGISCFMILVWY